MISFDDDDAYSAFLIEGSNSRYVASYGNNTDTSLIRLYTNSQSNSGFVLGASKLFGSSSFILGSMDSNTNTASSDMVICNHNIGCGGNSNPEFTVDIVGDLNFTGNVYKSSNILLIDAWAQGNGGIYHNTRIGVGTADPLRPLHVNTNAASISQTFGEAAIFNGAISVMHGINDGYRFISALDNTMANNTNRSIVFGKSLGMHNQAEITYTHVADNSQSNYMGLGLYGGVYASVAATGNVGIGTTSAKSKLTVAGGLTIGSDYTNVIAPDNMILVSGRIGIGTDAPQASIHTTSNVICGSLTSYGEIVSFSDMSDMYLKENFQEITGSLDKIGRLVPVEFTWRNDIFNKDRAGTKDSGLVAQNVEQVFPMVVGRLSAPAPNSTSNITYKTVKYEKIVPYLIQAMKELQRKVEVLEHKCSS